ncbi:MAG TPA: AtpZ/AtpI family protein [Candidatus Saccharimonadales bacterium]|nr:AtpZ/AtpI family protein [Candidatus Saccharimonadales bacterium]
MNKPAPHTQPTRKTTPEASDSKPSVPKLRVGREIADTTWRMTVPVVIFTFIGIFFDLRLGSAPWLTFLGVVVGFYFAIVLIKQQIKRSEEN